MYKLPFGLPSELTLPGNLGVLTGDVVVLVYIFALLLLISLFYFAFIALYLGRRARRAPSVYVDRVLADRGVTMGVSEPRFVVDPSSTRTMTRLETALAYEVALQRLAAHLTRKNAQNIYLGEIEDGFVLCYIAAGVATVETLTRPQVSGLALLKKKAAAKSVYSNLGLIGRFLDQQSALSVRLAEQQSGYYVEFATPTAAYPATAKVVRVSRTMDQEALTRLGARE